MGVDFSAHIVHFFLAASGNRDSRVEATMTRVGPAVFNGGLSTLLAFILLSTSRSYVFLSFFKIFFLICVLGLFHGLLLLPVLLALVGPPSRQPTADSQNSREDGDEGGRDKAHLQKDIQNVEPDVTSDEIDEITPLKD